VIDLHCHILPGVDDGAKTGEESAAMLQMAANDGITDIVASPHANDQYAYDRDAVQERVAALRAQCPAGLTLHCGCDFHLSHDNIRDAVKNPWRYVIDDTAYILVEFPEFINAPVMDRVLHDLTAAGMIPIITHPERNPVLQRQFDILQAWVERDCLIQITAQSILGDFGRKAKSAASELLRSGLVHIVATDAHDTRRRPPLLSEARREVRKRHGEKFADSLFTANPSKALAGRPITAAAKPARRLWGFA
jgi:protein-tyrosine phosphatase